MNLNNYDYHLPEAAIALHPPKQRGASRLLCLNLSTGALADRRYAELDSLVQSGDVLVINNTKVLPARLVAKTANGAERELLSAVDRLRLRVRGRETVRFSREQARYPRSVTERRVHDNSGSSLEAPIPGRRRR